MSEHKYVLQIADVLRGEINRELTFDAADMAWLIESLGDAWEAEQEAPVRARMVAWHDDSVFKVSASITGAFHGKCGRCLEKQAFYLDFGENFVFMSRATWEETYDQQEEAYLSAEDLDVSILQGNAIDLGALVREAIMLELSVFPQCGPEDSAACDEGYRRNVGEGVLAQNEENSLDLRWSALRNLKLGSQDPGSSQN